MNKVESFYNMCKFGIIEVNTRREKDIDQIIDDMSRMPMFYGITLNEIEGVRNRIKADMSITLRLGDCIEGEGHYEKWFLTRKSKLEMRYWNRYKMYLEKEKGFHINVVNGIDDILDKLTDLLGDPKSDYEFSRRGLVVGDVQSGKTSNYIGLMCKAADAGYNIIILLTGMIERLRKQTQMRVDEGFTGRKSAAAIKKDNNRNASIGVGNYDNKICPIVLTSTEKDFKTATARSVNFNFESVKDPVLFVVKKNVTTLRQLNNWIRTFNQNGNEKINKSLLLIDDESDNASINTNKENQDPTSINRNMRDLLNIFKKSSYIGFTATPFANIFIQPETDDDMFKEDLFPKDYIYSLDAPSNYIGARDIFNEDGKNRNMLVEINEFEIEQCIPKKHKNDFRIKEIPSDLKEAIYTFFLANTIRDLRGDEKTHRSMLINVSRFTNVQNELYEIVNSFVKEIQYSVSLYGKLSFDEAKKNNHISMLQSVFNKFYDSIEFNWNDIQDKLCESIASIVVVVVNKDHDGTLNYEEYKSGLRVIAIGGLSLSRGLTLEGLIVSYFYRNSKMYDTLMQMGRWFGYRKGYEDLCKIWMTEESISWYEHISMATDELKEEIKQYQDTGLTPKDFGLRVRADITSLIVTARNKMRTSSLVKTSISLSGNFVETPQLFSDVDNNQFNNKQVKLFVEKIKNNKIPLSKMRNSVGFYDVNKEIIIEFLESCKIPLLGLYDVNILKDFINDYPNKELDYWDVAFVSGESNDKFIEIENEKIKLVKRSFSIRNNNRIIQIGGKKNRLGGSYDTIYALNDNQINEVKKNVAIIRGEKKSLNQRDYLIYTKRKPLLLIYPIELKDSKEKETPESIQVKEKLENIPIIGISLNIPKLNSYVNKTARYQVNKIYIDALENEYFDNCEDEEEYED